MSRVTIYSKLSARPTVAAADVYGNWQAFETPLASLDAGNFIDAPIIGLSMREDPNHLLRLSGATLYVPDDLDGASVVAWGYRVAWALGPGTAFPGATAMELWEYPAEGGAGAVLNSQNAAAIAAKPYGGKYGATFSLFGAGVHLKRNSKYEALGNPAFGHDGLWLDLWLEVPHIA